VLAADGALIISTTHPTSDWLRLGGSYFTTEPVENSLSPRHDWPVRAWRLPLTSVCDEFHRAGFVIERLVEPRPVPEMAQRYPEDYARLGNAPAFIVFRSTCPCLGLQAVAADGACPPGSGGDVRPE
jgi:hypothetical protein